MIKFLIDRCGISETWYKSINGNIIKDDSQVRCGNNSLGSLKTQSVPKDKTQTYEALHITLREHGYSDQNIIDKFMILFQKILVKKVLLIFYCFY